MAQNLGKLTDGLGVVLAEIGNRVVVRLQLPQQPHHLDVAATLALQATRGADTVEVAVDEQLEQNSGMVGGAAVLGKVGAEAQLLERERIDEGVDQAYLVVGGDQLLQAGPAAGRLGATANLFEFHS